MKKKYKYLFGPVHSRRLGESLGVDTVPYKTCSMDCIYCESGKTTVLTMERKDFFPPEDIISELRDFLQTAPVLDYVTFSGAGEPLLYSGIGKIITFLKTYFPQYKIALLTNSMLLTEPDAFNAALQVDLIVPSLDAAIESVFEKINRPFLLKGGCRHIIETLKSFRKKSNAVFLLEILLITDINDTDQNINALCDAVCYIKPDKIQLNTLDRPGTENNISPLPYERLLGIADKFKKCDIPIDIVARKYANVTTEINKTDILPENIDNIVLDLIKRRPSTVNDIAHTLGFSEKKVQQIIWNLIKNNKIIEELREKLKFYKKK